MYKKYSKCFHEHKSFYAFFRRLCGTITALELAKRDVVLGLNAPLWKMLFPAVAGVHCIANLKGKKPILKWNFRLSC
jgi:hypothetical protein